MLRSTIDLLQAFVLFGLALFAWVLLLLVEVGFFALFIWLIYRGVIWLNGGAL